MTAFRLPIALILAILAVVLNIGSITVQPTARQALFAQGALRPLLTAEKQIRKGHIAESLECWQVCALRMRRESLLREFDSIRQRVGLAGRLAWPDHAMAWTLMSRYVLYDSNFGAAAARVEGYILSSSRPVARFDYQLTTLDGSKTVWNEGPISSPIWLYRHLPREFPLVRVPGLLYNIKVSELPPLMEWAHVYKVRLLIVQPTSKTFLRILEVSPQAYQWFDSQSGLIQWAKPATLEGQTAQVLSLSDRANTDLDRIIAFGAKMQPNASITLVREYKPLRKAYP